MTQLTVGTRELKSKLSEYLRHVKEGQVVTVTERGKVIGKIIPTSPANTEDHIWAMVDANLAEWNGKKLTPRKPKIINTSDRQISDIVIEDRR